MIGAIAGDIIGSPFEFGRGNKSEEFELFSQMSQITDDTVMTVAIADALMQLDGDETNSDVVFSNAMREYGRRYPNPMGGYGGRFYDWLFEPDKGPYDSYGNGSAMRVSAVGWAFDSLEEVEHWAELSAQVTHNHPEGVKGAQATAAAIFLARRDGGSAEAKQNLRGYLTDTYSYDLTRTLADIRPDYQHVESCQESVPEAITAYLESDGFEDAVRKAVSLGGDTDTQAAIAGAIAQAAYGVPADIVDQVQAKLDEYLLGKLNQFDQYLSGI